MVNVAVIGLGNMGKHHARNYTKIDGVRLAAVCDINKELAKNTSEKFACKAYFDYKEMISDEKIKAVSIAVPTKFHKEISLYCINKKIDVLIEKPIAATLEDGESINHEAKKNNVVLQIGHVERFNPAVQKLKEIITQSKLGEITSIIARRVGAVPIQVRDTNVIIDLAVHDIDIINYLFDETPSSITSNIGKAVIEKMVDYAEIFMKYGKKSGFIQVNWITPIKIRSLSVTGTKGYAELNYITQELVVYESNYTKEGKDEYGDYVVKFGIPNKVQIGVENSEPLYAELRHFIECVKNRKKPLVTGEIGLSALRIALEVMNSEKKD